ncbi:MAG: MCE family protein [Mycobacteriales bacterium]
MLRIGRGVKAQLVTFLVIAAAGITYTGAHFVGFSVFNPTYRVVLDLPSSGGIFTNAEVSYRGVPVGRVGALRLTPTGVAVDLNIDQGTKIPADTRAVVANLSAVGEQYVDLEPQTDTPPYLQPGQVIPQQDAAIPINDETLLINLENLAGSVNLRDLSITIAELGKAFAGTGPALHQLIASGDALTASAMQNLPTDIQLINDGKTVLDTQRQVAGDLATFSANLAQFSGQLVASDSDLRALLDNGVGGTAQLQSVLASNAQALPVLLGNLITLGQIQMVRLPGLKVILLLYPGSVADGFLTAPGDGTAHFGLITDSNPAVCTNGYQAVKHRNGSGNNPQVNDGGPANLNVDCTDKSSPTTLDDLRGARNAPRPPGDTTGTVHTYTEIPFPYGAPTTAPGYAAVAGSVPAPATAAPVAGIGPYDPISGLFAAPSGVSAEIGTVGGEQSLLGNQGWQYLLYAPLSG